MSSLSCRRHVAVIGAGAAGLVAARELIREGHDTVVFESETRVGGTWIYNPETDSNLTLHDPAQNVVHSSVYESLRTNLPRELMGFRDFPFTAEEGSRDSRRFPRHEEVLWYLERFAAEFGLHEVIRFGKKVEQARDYDDGRWRVAWRDVQDAAEAEEEVFDAVVVCSGHFSVPRLAEITGIELYRGKQIHSHNYRTPQQFLDQVVVIIGSSISAMDISRDILGFAKEVHITCRATDITPLGKQPNHHNLWVHPMIESIREDGSILFLDGNFVHAGVILHCTGYKYHFPFLEKEGAIPVTVDEGRVEPLYKHVFPPAYAPRLSFVGIIQKVLPFIQFEIQSKWIASAISGRITLPSQEDMNVNIEEFYARIEAKGVPKWYTHTIYYNSEDQFEYYDGLARECGCEPIEEWRKRMWAKHVIIPRKPSRLSEHRKFLDEFDDEDRELVAEAYKEFGRHGHNKRSKLFTRVHT